MHNQVVDANSAGSRHFCSLAGRARRIRLSRPSPLPVLEEYPPGIKSKCCRAQRGSPESACSSQVRPSTTSGRSQVRSAVPRSVRRRHVIDKLRWDKFWSCRVGRHRALLPVGGAPPHERCFTLANDQSDQQPAEGEGRAPSPNSLETRRELRHWRRRSLAVGQERPAALGLLRTVQVGGRP